MLTDGTARFTYRIDRKPYPRCPATSASSTVSSFGKDAADRLGRYPTPVTCEPEQGHSHRLIARAHLDTTRTVEDGMPEAPGG